MYVDTLQTFYLFCFKYHSLPYPPLYTTNFTVQTFYYKNERGARGRGCGDNARLLSESSFQNDEKKGQAKK